MKCLCFTSLHISIFQGQEARIAGAPATSKSQADWLPAFWYCWRTFFSVSEKGADIYFLATCKYILNMTWYFTLENFAMLSKENTLLTARIFLSQKNIFKEEEQRQNIISKFLWLCTNSTTYPHDLKFSVIH